ncbi:MAG: Flp pilus assembly protein CpaB [Planctomycetia bacterium]|nr:Flp pilus assembly protein CpaB [Planctomycetia bacterium]
MRPKSLILLALALGCGLVASIGISQVMESRRAQQNASDEKTEILVALADIERNTELSPKNVGLRPWPKAQLPEGAVTKIEDIVGHRPNARIVKGEAILEGKLGTGEGVVRATNEIPKDFRVVSVKVNASDGAGLILPGDRVDVQVFINKGPNVAEAGTWTFLHDVSVFAVNSEMRHEANSDAKIDAKTVSLLVKPEQAAKVTLAAEVGTIRLVMRGSHPDESTTEGNASITGILGSGGEQATHTEAKAGDKVAAVLEPAPVKKTEPVVDDVIHRMLVVSGSESHVEEFHKGELMPRRQHTESNGSTGTPANTDSGATAPATSSGPATPTTDVLAPFKTPAPVQTGATRDPAPIPPKSTTTPALAPAHD